MSAVPLWYRREIKLGDSGPDVAVVRRKLGLDPSGSFDESTAERVRGLAKRRSVKSKGEVTEDVARELGESSTAELTPEWFSRTLNLWTEGNDVRTLRGLLGLGTNDDRFDPDCESAVRRFQSQHRLEPSGVVDESLAKLIGEAP